MNEIGCFLTCHNQGRFVKQAIDSVLLQTEKPTEMVLIDDGSDDETWSVMKEYQDFPDTCMILIQHKRRQGHIASYNEGIETLSTPLVHLMAGDDYFDLDHGGRKFYRKAKTLLEKDDRVGFVTCGLRLVGFDGTSMQELRVPPMSGIHPPERILATMANYGNFINGGGTVVRRTAQKHYEKDLPYTADWFQWISVCRDGWKGGFIPEPIYCYRQWRKQMTNVLSNQEKSKQRNVCVTELAHALQIARNGTVSPE